MDMHEISSQGKDKPKDKPIEEINLKEKHEFVSKKQYKWLLSAVVGVGITVAVVTGVLKCNRHKSDGNGNFVSEWVDPGLGGCYGG